MAEQKIEKKRTVYKEGNLLDFPEHMLDRTKYGYKWRAAEQLAHLSDGYDPKGWELFKDKDGKPVRRGDLILAQMPMDRYLAMKEYKDEMRKRNNQHVFETQAAELERDSHEFRKKGGKLKFEFTQE